MVQFIRNNPAADAFKRNTRALAQTRINDARLDDVARQDAKRSVLADVVAGSVASAAPFSGQGNPLANVRAEGPSSSASMSKRAPQPARPQQQPFNQRAATALADRGLGMEAANYMTANNANRKAVADKATNQMLALWKAGDTNSLVMSQRIGEQNGLIGDGESQIPAAMFKSARARALIVEATEALKAAGVPPQHMGAALTRYIQTNKPFAEALQAALAGVPAATPKPLTMAAKAQSDLKNGLIDAPTHKAILAGAGKPTTQITVDQKGRTKEQETIGAYHGDLFVSLQKAANVARTDDVQLNWVSQLVKGLETGALAPLSQAFKKGMKSAGIDLNKWGLSDDVGQAEALESIGTNITLEAVQRTKGAVSEKEMDLFLQTAPSLNKSPEGIMLIVDMRREMNKRAREVAALARKYLAENNTMSQFDEVLEHYHNQNPLFTEELNNKVAKIQQASATEVNPETVEAELEDLTKHQFKIGDEVVDENGEWTMTDKGWVKKGTGQLDDASEAEQSKRLDPQTETP